MMGNLMVYMNIKSRETFGCYNRPIQLVDQFNPT